MHWKRLIELTAPLWIAAAAVIAAPPAFSSMRWLNISAFYSPYWIVFATAVAWVCAAIFLRPLSASNVAVHGRFSLCAALLLSWAMSFYVIRDIQVADMTGDRQKVYPIFIPVIILIWGARERLKCAAAPVVGRCVVCGYNLIGLSAGAPCPECGRAPATPSPNNPT
ncbi:MAG: hypothetical protein QM783_00570 [Phycisphaerales bacterium]